MSNRIGIFLLLFLIVILKAKIQLLLNMVIKIFKILLILTKFNKYWQWNFSVLLGVVLVVIVGVCLILSGALVKSKFYL